MSGAKLPWWAIDGPAALVAVLCACVVAALLAGTPYIQSIPYGVLLLSGFVFLVAGAAIRLMERNPLLKPERFSTRFVEVWRTKFLIGVLLIPTLISWVKNESFSAAFNPKGYWTEEASKLRHSDCGFLRTLVVNSADEVRVAQNKHAMGIATNSEVLSKLMMFEEVDKLYNNCRMERANRIRHAERMLAVIAGHQR